MAKKTTFDSGAHLAFFVDREAGYRKAANSWEFIPIDDRHLEGFEVSSVLEKYEHLPKLQLLPESDGMIRALSNRKLATQDFDESRPQISLDGETTINYGGVVRVEHLLVAVLYKEQREAIDAGKLCLSVIGAPRDGTLEDAQKGDQGAHRLRELRNWRLLWLTLATIAVTPLALGIMTLHEIGRAVSLFELLMAGATATHILIVVVIAGLPMDQEHRFLAVGANQGVIVLQYEKIDRLQAWFSIWGVGYIATALLAFFAWSCFNATGWSTAQGGSSLFSFLSGVWLYLVLSLPVSIFGIPIHLVVLALNQGFEQRALAQMK